MRGCLIPLLFWAETIAFGDCGAVSVWKSETNDLGNQPLRPLH